MGDSNPQRGDREKEEEEDDDEESVPAVAVQGWMSRGPREEASESRDFRGRRPEAAVWCVCICVCVCL